MHNALSLLWPHKTTNNMKDNSKGNESFGEGLMWMTLCIIIPTTDCIEINQEKVAIAKKSTTKLSLRYFSLLSKF